MFLAPVLAAVLAHSSCPPTFSLSQLHGGRLSGLGNGVFVSAIGFRLLLQVIDISILLFNNKLVTLHLKLS